MERDADVREVIARINDAVELRSFRIIPAENGKDLEEIDQTVRKALRFVLVDQAEQVLAEALCCLGGGAEAGRAMDRKLPGEKSRGTARLRQ